METQGQLLQVFSEFHEMESCGNFRTTTHLFIVAIPETSQPGQANVGVISIVLHRSIHIIALPCPDPAEKNARQMCTIDLCYKSILIF